MPYIYRMNPVYPDLDAVEKALHGRPPVTRFAPSPTGYLHLGHVVNAIYVWGLAGAIGAKVILRLEDHDRQRCRPEYEAALLQDLEWLGLQPDFGKPEAFRAGPSRFRQSDCQADYVALLDRLRTQAHVYACDCSRKEIMARAPQTGNELRYDGHCCDRGLEENARRGIRLQLPPDEVRFHDLLAGPQVQVPAAQCGDVLLRDRHGQWTYQLAVLADDVRQGVNLIVRGMDILTSSGRQLQIARMAAPDYDPVLLHHGLLVDADGRKLSKRDFAADIHARMRAGEDPEAVLGEAAALAGLIPKPRKIAANSLPGLFLRGNAARERA